MTAMAKVRLLAVLTMDGCPAETTGLSGRWLGSDQYGIGALKDTWFPSLRETAAGCSSRRCPKANGHAREADNGRMVW